MSILTTWTSTAVDTREPSTLPGPQRDHRGRTGPRPAWDCVNCSVLNPGTRKRCADCGTTRD